MLKLYLDGELCASGYDKETGNPELSGGAITVGDDAFYGRLAEVSIWNKALGYDEIPAYDQEKQTESVASGGN